MKDSFQTKTTLTVGGKHWNIFSLENLRARFPQVERLPFSLKILLENLLRHEDDISVTKEDIETLATWDNKRHTEKEIAFMPSRVLMQDFTGVPAIVDLAAMRDAMAAFSKDPKKINPLRPAELVIDHSVQVDVAGIPEAVQINSQYEFERNRERYAFLKWGQSAFDNLKIVPPDTGIVHQVNLEYLARVTFAEENNSPALYPDTLVGTDSHTTMINGLGVLGWGVGGIEAEAVMLGQPITMLIPEVIGVRLTGKLQPGTTATDLVLTITQMLRNYGVVGKFVEFFGTGLSNLRLADRATIANMAPEYGATCGIFPIDEETLRYLALTGRSQQQIDLVEAYCRAQGLWASKEDQRVEYTEVLELDLATVAPCIAGPKRPQDRIPLKEAKKSFLSALNDMRQGQPPKKATVVNQGKSFTIEDGAIVIAAITSCTNTSNPAALLAAGLLAQKAVEKGLNAKPWVKTSLAPGSKVVAEYLREAGLLTALEKTGFYLVGYGCTTCIGNSGPLPENLSDTIKKEDIAAAAVLSGNRNFEGRIHPLVKMNYLASPPLVVAYALAGNMNIDFETEPLGQDQNGNPVYLKDLWPDEAVLAQAIDAIQARLFKETYAKVLEGDENWRNLQVEGGDLYAWDQDSTYIQNPPYFKGMTIDVSPPQDIRGGRVLCLLGDSITTDHISPAGSIAEDSPAGQYLITKGVSPKDFNSYGARRGNHEVMMRGTFANIRLKNLLVPGTEGWWTKHFPSGEKISIFDASVRYQQEKVPLLVIAGKEYGSGSSRDWAAKGPRLLGVRAVIAESFERIHRSNLVGMGILPLQFKPGEHAASLGLSGEESYDILGSNGGKAKEVEVIATKNDGSSIRFSATCRIDTPQEVYYYQHGSILHYVLRQLMTK